MSKPKDLLFSTGRRIRLLHPSVDKPIVILVVNKDGEIKSSVAFSIAEWREATQSIIDWERLSDLQAHDLDSQLRAIHRELTDALIAVGLPDESRSDYWQGFAAGIRMLIYRLSSQAPAVDPTIPF